MDRKHIAIDLTAGQDMTLGYRVDASWDGIHWVNCILYQDGKMWAHEDPFQYAFSRKVPKKFTDTGLIMSVKISDAI